MVWSSRFPDYSPIKHNVKLPSVLRMTQNFIKQEKFLYHYTGCSNKIG